MSRQLGYFSDDAVRDFPELNKCPDCETFFADDNCPICGKRCPEEYRSGNRKPIKQKKRRRSSGNGRVRFVPWYHTAPVIIALLILQPIIGLILLWTSDTGRTWKIVGTIGAVLWGSGWLVGAIIGGLMGLLFGFTDIPPVERMEPAEYMEYCEAVDPATLYDASEDYYFCDVKLDATVKEVLFKQSEFVEEENLTYYLCEAKSGENTYEFLIRDCRMRGRRELSVGSNLTLYGAVMADNILHTVNGGTRYGVSLEMYYDTLR